MLGVLNYGVGNLRSVVAALQSVSSEDVRVIEPQQHMDSCSGLVIPGVGSFSVGSSRLCTPLFSDNLHRFLESGRKVLGICLGMQLMLDKGIEGEPCAGLSLIDGTVEKLRLQEGARLPNMGWRPIQCVGEHPIFEGIQAQSTFYFCHSYHALPGCNKSIAAITKYGEDKVVAAVQKATVVGVQFHPEKSGRNGLALLKNFCTWCEE